MIIEKYIQLITMLSLGLLMGGKVMAQVPVSVPFPNPSFEQGAYGTPAPNIPGWTNCDDRGDVFPFQVGGGWAHNVNRNTLPAAHGSKYIGLNSGERMAQTIPGGFKAGVAYSFTFKTSYYPFTANGGPGWGQLQVFLIPSLSNNCQWGNNTGRLLVYDTGKVSSIGWGAARLVSFTPSQDFEGIMFQGLTGDFMMVDDLTPVIYTPPNPCATDTAKPVFTPIVNNPVQYAN